MGVVIDTSCLVTLERSLGRGELTPRHLPEDPFISSVTAAELLVGWQLADPDHVVRRRAFVDAVFGLSVVLPFDLTAAEVYAAIAAKLRRDGQRIGDRDLMIAATAIAHGHSLMTANVGEFSRVEGLTLVPIP